MKKKTALILTFALALAVTLAACGDKSKAASSASTAEAKKSVAYPVSAASTAKLDGKAIMAARCTVCHNTDRIFNAMQHGENWSKTVPQMIKNGAKLNDEEKAAVIAYLKSQTKY